MDHFRRLEYSELHTFPHAALVLWRQFVTFVGLPADQWGGHEFL